MLKKHIDFNRETLYKEVWEEPMTTVSKRYGISNTYLKKVCKNLQIPTPGLGHWTKVKSGEKIKPPKLPKYTGPKIDNPNFNTTLSYFDYEYNKYDEQRKFEKLKEEALDWELAMKIRSYIYAVESRILAKKISKDKKSNMIKKIKWAKKKADWLDPFIATDDPLLGKKRGKIDCFLDNEDS